MCVCRALGDAEPADGTDTIDCTEALLKLPGDRTASGDPMELTEKPRGEVTAMGASSKDKTNEVGRDLSEPIRTRGCGAAFRICVPLTNFCHWRGMHCALERIFTCSSKTSL